MARARQVLETGKLVMAHEDYITAVNRAYYAIFYAANALLTTKGLERSKHSGVIAAFRQHFVKTGVIEPEFSRFYGAAMDERHAADYELEPLNRDSASRHLENAERFVTRIEWVLREIGALDE
ncbi:MAG TPA: HEPN domain-containing protein [Anaerolineae bacterium]